MCAKVTKTIFSPACFSHQSELLLRVGTGIFFATFEISLAVLGIGAMNKTVWHIGTM